MTLSPEILDRLRSREARYQELAELMAEPDVTSDLARLRDLGREQANLEELVTEFQAYQAIQKELYDATSVLDETPDEEMRAMAREEVEHLEQRLEERENALKRLLAPRDPRDAKDVIVEIRAGTGGEEASLFAADLFRMYSRYAERKG